MPGARRRHTGPFAPRLSNPYDPDSPSLSASDSETAPFPAAQQQQALEESLPLLQVHGLEAYEASQKAGDYMHLSSMVSELASSFQTLHALTTQQQQSLDHVESRVEGARDRTVAGEGEIRKASRYKAMGLVVAGGVTGAALGGPLGALVGLKTGLSVGVGIGLLGAGGALLGAAAGKQIQKARFVPLTHQEEEMQEMNSAPNSAAASTSAASSTSSTPQRSRTCDRNCT